MKLLRFVFPALLLCAMPFARLSAQEPSSDPQQSAQEQQKKEAVKLGEEEQTQTPEQEQANAPKDSETQARQAASGEEGGGGSTAQVPEAQSTAKEGDTAEGVVEEEDMLIIEDEGEESIIEEEIGLPVQHIGDTAKAVEEVSGEGEQTPAESAPDRGEYAHEGPHEGGTAAGSETVSIGQEKKRAVIEQARSINFAKNLAEYRSPRTAMFLSLVLPGLGQAYAKRYWKTALFGIAEATIIGIGVNFAIKGRDGKADAQTFADRNFNVNRFWSYYTGLDSLVRHQTTFNDSMVADVKQTIIWDSTEFAQSAASKNNDYYRNLEREAMVQGWKDCEPVINHSDLQFTLDSPDYKYKYAQYQETGQGDTVWLLTQLDKNTGDTIATYLWGYSHLQRQYVDQVHEYNRYYRISTNVLFLLLANHVISAVDAMISARAHNDRLLGKESFWQRIDIDQQLAYNGVDVIGKFGVRVRF